MRRRRVLFMACLTACTFAGAASAAHAMAAGLGQSIGELSSINLRDSVLLGCALGQILGLLSSSVLIAAGNIRGRTFHALKGATSAAAITAILIWPPLWVFVAACAAC